MSRTRKGDGRTTTTLTDRIFLPPTLHFFMDKIKKIVDSHFLFPLITIPFLLLTIFARFNITIGETLYQ
jgi:hypothetical protein